MHKTKVYFRVCLFMKLLKSSKTGCRLIVFKLKVEYLGTGPSVMPRLTVPCGIRYSSICDCVAFRGQFQSGAFTNCSLVCLQYYLKKLPSVVLYTLKTETLNKCRFNQRFKCVGLNFAFKICNTLVVTVEMY